MITRAKGAFKDFLEVFTWDLPRSIVLPNLVDQEESIKWGTGYGQMWFLSLSSVGTITDFGIIRKKSGRHHAQPYADVYAGPSCSSTTLDEGGPVPPQIRVRHGSGALERVRERDTTLKRFSRRSRIPKFVRPLLLGGGRRRRGKSGEIVR